jgi:hypothetical protein
VVWRNHQHRVEVFLLFQHRAEVAVRGTGFITVFLFDSLLGSVTIAGIDIADGNDLHVRFVEEALHISRALVAYAYAGDIDFLARLDITGSAEDISRHNRKRRDRRRTAYKIATGNIRAFLFRYFVVTFHIGFS